MDGTAVMELAQSFLDQDQDIAFGFTANEGRFVVVGFSANEAVNAPFEINIELASEDADIDLHALMDTQACLGIYDKYDAPRFLNGIITEVSRGDSGIRRTFYSVTLRPALQRLAHTSDSRIWQSKTVPDIIKQVLEEHNIINVDWRLAGTHEPREYCTQYRETALAFVERLLGEEGVFYFFEHSTDAHTLIITDAPLTTPVLAAAPLITYNAQSGGQLKGNAISAFSQHERLRSSNYEMNDYTFKNPTARMNEARMKQEDNGLSADYKLYDHPGRYKNPSTVGGDFTQHRMESVRVDATTGQGVTNNIHLCAGFHFSICDHDDAKVNASHFLLSVRHSGRQSAALQEDAGSAPTTYSASFTTMPARLPYRPPLVRKPLVDGPQIATVTGPEGEEIYCDEHGRVKVFFPWDRYGEKNEHSSCWVRVSQNWAGGTWGSIAIPRIGHEVIVDYLEGDPDQPIVTGRTYHANNKSPYKLPDNKTRMSIKSQTHKGVGFNEMRFEDEEGKEEIFFHAQKDRNEKIEHNQSERVNINKVESIGYNKSSEIGNNLMQVVDGNMEVRVGPAYAGTISPSGASKDTQGIGHVALRVGMPGKSERGQGNLAISVEQNKVQSIGETHHEDVAKRKSTNVGTDYDLYAKRNIHIEAGDEIMLTCGASQITLTSDGIIRVNGKKIFNVGTDLVELLADVVKVN
ncbi:type VI secretion system tip protein VgrG [Halocynthiibacter namhaensis]|uniref:type VI secretion system Vgr family protein n=1 Tax=Halocynthiibacter namhaensis TaxID=1290553 RepID=UPI00068E7B57|nr:type VI secretion system tip protein VgrG [Halocynthiibacter namhaensis]